MDPDSGVSEVQRRIELQSPEDLAYLIANVRDAAAARLDEAFPPVEGAAGEEDELRTQIQALVAEYIDRTFSLAAPNLTINGLPVDPAPFLGSGSGSSSGSNSGTAAPPAAAAYEPFDPRKRAAVAALIAQEERLLEDVAALKRGVPGKAAAEHAERVRAGMRQDEEDLRARVERDAAAAAAAAAGAGGLAVRGLARQGGVEDGFRDAATGLGRLKRDMPAAVAKMERARLAGEYVVAKGRQ
ncbi:Kinetochore protein mis14 [Escovopsis weberi]|uniref:Kinetochore protein mis14 n=1 Tax=Escovopsis weberi TaxID=150374 RepID=A0A0N0RT06_ESCWE|nr:Kinetochore protein mis14 [Escovopsis weberi]